MDAVLDHLLKKCIDLIPLDPEVKMVKKENFFMMVKKEDESAAEIIDEPESDNEIPDSSDIVFISSFRSEAYCGLHSIRFESSALCPRIVGSTI